MDLTSILSALGGSAALAAILGYLTKRGVQKNDIKLEKLQLAIDDMGKEVTAIKVDIAKIDSARTKADKDSVEFSDIRAKVYEILGHIQTLYKLIERIES